MAFVRIDDVLSSSRIISEDPITFNSPCCCLNFKGPALLSLIPESQNVVDDNTSLPFQNLWVSHSFDGARKQVVVRWNGGACVNRQNIPILSNLVLAFQQLWRNFQK